MIFSKAISYEDIVKNLDKENDVISMIGCETCVRVAGSGGREVMKNMALRLRKDGYKVKEGFLVPTACNPKLSFASPANDVNTVLSLACSAGSSNILRIFPECRLVQTIEDAGLMVTDTSKKILKITMPFENYEDETGFEYECLSGKKTESNDNLPIMERREDERVLEAVR